MSELEGERITRAFFTNQTFPEIAIDYFFGGKQSLNMESDLIKRIVEESWYGATIFKKYSPSPTGYTEGGASASSTPAPTTADANASPATASAAGAVVKRTIQTRQRLSVNLVKQRLKAAPMSDACTPCIQEHDDWVKASLDLERQRFSLEELAVFEREVEERRRAEKTAEYPQRSKEKGDLKGLTVHSEEPRLLMDSDFK